jgi:hypothetical protein
MERIYNCTVKLSNGNWVTYHSVKHLGKFVAFADNKLDWLFFNVYDNADKSKSNDILGTFQNGKNRNVPSSKHI